MITGFLHPGAMGASLAACCSGDRIWASTGRSATSRERAEAAGLIDAVTVEEMAARADVIVSVCPPAAAIDQARAVAATGYDGVYVDANAVAPETSRQIGALLPRFVDGGLIGPPVDGPGSTRLYLAGDDAEHVARRWRGSDLEVRVLHHPPGAASAVKVCFAAWTKGTAALLLAVRALARAEGVDRALLDEWAVSIPDLAERSELTAFGNAPKAWRFVGEMDQISMAFGAHHLPDGFGEAAANLYGRLAAFKDAPGPTLEAAVEEILGRGGVTAPSVEQFLELERRVWDALVRGDADADAALLTDDFLGVYPTGFATRAEHAAQLAGGPIVGEYELSEPRLLVLSDDDVLLAYRARFTRPPVDDLGAAPEPLDWYITSLWTRVGDVWLNRFSQDTPAH